MYDGGVDQGRRLRSPAAGDNDIWVLHILNYWCLQSWAAICRNHLRRTGRRQKQHQQIHLGHVTTTEGIRINIIPHVPLQSEWRINTFSMRLNPVLSHANPNERKFNSQVEVWRHLIVIIGGDTWCIVCELIKGDCMDHMQSMMDQCPSPTLGEHDNDVCMYKCCFTY